MPATLNERIAMLDAELRESIRQEKREHYEACAARYRRQADTCDADGAHWMAEYLRRLADKYARLALLA